MPSNFLKQNIKFPKWATNRFNTLEFYQLILDGKHYNHISTPFYVESDNNGTYIPLRNRRPSTRYNMAKIVVNRSTRMVFGDKHFPKIISKDQKLNDFAQSLRDDYSLQGIMLEAAIVGSIGSALVVVQVIDGDIQFEVLSGRWCSPIFKPNRQLSEVLITYPVIGYDLVALGYNIAEDDRESRHIFARRLTELEEIYYFPVLESEYAGPESLKYDKDRSQTHDLGMLNAVWGTNLLPNCGLEGQCTFEPLIDMNIELDYQLSQCGRGLKYNADPQLLIKEPAGSELGSTMPPVRTTSNAIFVGSDGDAKLLEISGKGQMAVVEYAKLLRQYALESVSSSRKDPQNAHGNMSGRSMEMLEGDLISLAAELRLTWGEKCLKEIVLLAAKIADKLGLDEAPHCTNYKAVGLQLYWGNWFDPTPVDLFQTEQALTEATNHRRLFEHEGRMITATTWDIGHAKPEQLEAEWPLPPEPKNYLEESKAKAQSITGGAAGDDGRPTVGE